MTFKATQKSFSSAITFPQSLSLVGWDLHSPHASNALVEQLAGLF